MSSVETNKQTKSYSSVFHLQQETSLWEIWLKSYLITLADMSGGKYVCGYCLDNNYKIIHCLANWITINQFYLLQNWITFDFLTWGWAHPHQGNKRIEASNAFIEVKHHIHMHAHAYTHMHSHICTHPSHTQSLAPNLRWTFLSQYEEMGVELQWHNFVKPCLTLSLHSPAPRTEWIKQPEIP